MRADEFLDRVSRVWLSAEIKTVSTDRHDPSAALLMGIIEIDEDETVTLATLVELQAAVGVSTDKWAIGTRYIRPACGLAEGCDECGHETALTVTVDFR